MQPLNWLLLLNKCRQPLRQRRVPDESSNWVESCSGSFAREGKKSKFRVVNEQLVGNAQLINRPCREARQTEAMVPSGCKKWAIGLALEQLRL